MVGVSIQWEKKRNERFEETVPLTRQKEWKFGTPKGKDRLGDPNAGRMVGKFRARRASEIEREPSN